MKNKDKIKEDKEEEKKRYSLFNISMFILFIVSLIFLFMFVFAVDREAPSDHLRSDKIYVYDDKIIIELNNPTVTRFTDTNSMVPVLDKGANGVEIKPESPDDISVGDIISFKMDNYIIVHRVVKIGYDKEGVYYLTRGDNAPFNDPEKIRFNQVQGIIVVVIY